MWQVKDFSQLSTYELFQIYKLRTQVFVVEQGCPYPEVDEEDLRCIHAMYYDGTKLEAYFRLIPQVDGVHLGRVVVDPSQRRKGLGKIIVEKAIEVCHERFPEEVLHAQAQAYLKDFYESFGFVPVSKVYLEDNIPHLDMILR